MCVCVCTVYVHLQERERKRKRLTTNRRGRELGRERTRGQMLVPIFCQNFFLTHMKIHSEGREKVGKTNVCVSRLCT